MLKPSKFPNSCLTLKWNLGKYPDCTHYFLLPVQTSIDVGFPDPSNLCWIINFWTTLWRWIKRLNKTLLSLEVSWWNLFKQKQLFKTNLGNARILIDSITFNPLPKEDFNFSTRKLPPSWRFIFLKSAISSRRYILLWMPRRHLLPLIHLLFPWKGKES